jgi:fructokinase
MVLGSLKSPVRFVSSISQDEYGREICALLRRSGVNIDFSVFSELPTTLAQAELNDEGNASFSFNINETSIMEEIPEELVSGSLVGASCLAIGSLGIVLDNFRRATRFAVEEAKDGATIFLDPNIRPAIINEGLGRKRYLECLEWFCSRSRVVKCSVEDLMWWFPNNSLRNSVDSLLSQGPELIVLTRGSEGASAYFKKDELHSKTERTDNSNYIGAGDSFFGALISFFSMNGEAMFADRKLISDCLLYSNKVAHNWIERGIATL